MAQRKRRHSFFNPRLTIARDLGSLMTDLGMLRIDQYSFSMIPDCFHLGSYDAPLVRQIEPLRRPAGTPQFITQPKQALSNKMTARATETHHNPGLNNYHTDDENEDVSRTSCAAGRKLTKIDRSSHKGRMPYTEPTNQMTQDRREEQTPILIFHVSFKILNIVLLRFIKNIHVLMNFSSLSCFIQVFQVLFKFMSY